MPVSHDGYRGADSGGVSPASISTSCGEAAAIGNDHAKMITAQDTDWLVAHLRAVVSASPAIWASRGMTLPQLIALHLIGALAPVSLA